MEGDKEQLPAPAGEYGMTKEQEQALLEDKRPAFITILHGVSEAAMKGIDGARAGDFMLNGTKRIPASTFGPGFRGVPVLHRPQAILFEGNTPKKKTNDMASQTWQEIAAEVARYTKGAKVGFEFLLALPDYKRLGIIYLANEERFNSGTKVLEFMRQKRCVQFGTIIKGAKNMVKVTVEPARYEPGEWRPSDEDLKAAMDAFEAYKRVERAPQGPRR